MHCAVPSDPHSSHVPSEEIGISATDPYIILNCGSINHPPFPLVQCIVCERHVSKTERPYCLLLQSIAVYSAAYINHVRSEGIGVGATDP